GGFNLAHHAPGQACAVGRRMRSGVGPGGRDEGAGARQGGAGGGGREGGGGRGGGGAGRGGAERGRSRGQPHGRAESARADGRASVNAVLLRQNQAVRSRYPTVSARNTRADQPVSGKAMAARTAAAQNAALYIVSYNVNARPR